MQYYDHISEGYDELHGEEQRRKLKFVESTVNLGKDELVLDVGCGTGISFDIFPCKVIGLDPSLKLLKRSNGIVVQGIAESMPFMDDSFDLVISLSAVHNFTDPKKGLEEMKRVGKGRYVISLFRKGKDIEKLQSIQNIINDMFFVELVIEDEHDFLYFCSGLPD